MAQWPDHEREQLTLVVVTGDPVDVDGKAALAPVHEQPLAVRAGADRDRLHAAAAVGGAVAWRIVEMNTPKAPGTMVAMARAGRIERELAAAVTAFQIRRLLR